MSEHVRDRLSAYLDRELPPTDDDAVVAHLRGCEACRSHLAALTSVDKAARALPVEAPAGYFDTLPGRVRARLEATSATRAVEDEERERKRGPAPGRVGPPARAFGSSVRRPLGLPAWTWAVAAALLLAVVTPLTLREQRAPSTTPPAASPVAPPMTLTGENAASGPAPAREAVRKDVDSRKVRAEGLSTAAPKELHRDAVGGLLANAEPKPADQGFSVAPAPPPATAYPAEARSAEMESGTSARSPAPRAPAAAVPAPAAEKKPRAPGLGGPYAQAQSQSQAQLQAPAGQAAGGVAAGSTAEELTARVAAESTSDEVTAADAREGAREKQEGAPTTLAKSATERDEQGRDAAGGFANRAPAADEREFSRLLAPAAQTVGALRARREAWRTFALDYPRSRRTDEARVRVIDAGMAAWRLGHDPADLGQARVDAASYLNRPDAAQATRVRAILESVGGP